MRLARGGVVGEAVGFEGIQARAEDTEILDDRESECEKDYHNLQSRTVKGLRFEEKSDCEKEYRWAPSPLCRRGGDEGFAYFV